MKKIFLILATTVACLAVSNVSPAQSGQNLNIDQYMPYRFSFLEVDYQGRIILTFTDYEYGPHALGKEPTELFNYVLQAYAGGVPGVTATGHYITDYKPDPSPKISGRLVVVLVPPLLTQYSTITIGGRTIPIR